MPDSSTGSGIDMKIKTEEPCGWSRHAVATLRSCGCCCAFLGVGCFFVALALALCLAALFLLAGTLASFTWNLLFGAAVA